MGVSHMEHNPMMGLSQDAGLDFHTLSHKDNSRNFRTLPHYTSVP